MRLRRIFARNLRRLRTEKGISQEALADAAQVDRTYVSSLERELYSVSLDTIERIADALGIDADQLFVK